MSVAAMRRGLASAPVLAACLLVGCAAMSSMPPSENPFKAPPLVVRVGEDAQSAPIALSRGQTLVVSLRADLATPYRWEPLRGYAPTLADLGTPDYTLATAPPTVGTPGDMVFRFRGDAAGTTSLEFALRRPFEPDAAPSSTVRYSVTVE
jgi:predicted secreted protein